MKKRKPNEPKFSNDFESSNNVNLSKQQSLRRKLKLFAILLKQWNFPTNRADEEFFVKDWWKREKVNDEEMASKTKQSIC